MLAGRYHAVDGFHATVTGRQGGWRAESGAAEWAPRERRTWAEFALLERLHYLRRARKAMRQGRASEPCAGLAQQHGAASMARPSHSPALPIAAQMAPALSYPEKAGQGCPALAVLAAAKQAGVELELKALDAKTAKDAPVALSFPSGCAHMPGGPPAAPGRLHRPQPSPEARSRSIALQGGAGGRA